MHFENYILFLFGVEKIQVEYEFHLNLRILILFTPVNS